MTPIYIIASCINTGTVVQHCNKLSAAAKRPRKCHPSTFSKPNGKKPWANQPVSEMSLAESCLTLKWYTHSQLYSMYFFNDKPRMTISIERKMLISYLTTWSHPETSLLEMSFQWKAGIAHETIIIKSKLPEFSLHFPGVFCSLQWALHCHGYSYKHFTPPLKLTTSQLHYRHTLPGNSATDSFLTLAAKSKMWLETPSSFLREI